MLGTIRKTLRFRELLGAADEQATTQDRIMQIKSGDLVTFGVTPISDLSHQSCMVGHPTMFHFGGTQFASYPLYDAAYHTLCHMIIAQRASGNPYIALSKKIPDAHKAELCTMEDYQRLSQADYPQHLYVREHTPGMQDWLNTHYECKLRDARGTSISPEHEVKNFRYTLYMAVHEHKALEIERYPSGEFSAHATLFCPLDIIASVASDAGLQHLAMHHVRESSHDDEDAASHTLADAHHHTPQQPADQSATARPTPAPAPTAQTETEELVLQSPEADKAEHPQAERPQQSTVQSEPPQKESRTHAGAQPAQHHSEEHTKKTDSARIFTLPTTTKIPKAASSLIESPAEPKVQGSVRCNLRMASRLIDEALRSEMRVTDVMRKALGLNISDQDYVAFDLRLTERDYVILAERFDLDASEKERIHELIMEELRDFTGESFS